jgi:hypothetical protein
LGNIPSDFTNRKVLLFAAKLPYFNDSKILAERTFFNPIGGGESNLKILTDPDL